MYIFLFLVLLVHNVAAATKNPYFLQGGCLGGHHPTDSWKPRVCNSHDEEDTPYCRPSPYPEVRIAAQNFESSIFQAWVWQIVLSEILHVPVSIQGASTTSREELNFYHPLSTFDLSQVPAYDWNALQMAQRAGGDCSLSTQPYCAHVLPEASTQRQEQDGVDSFLPYIQPLPVKHQMIGQAGLYIPKYTAGKNPSFMTYHGFQHHSGALGRSFPRPVRWGDYCQMHHRCVNHPKPQHEEEAQRFYVPGLYQGYFVPCEGDDCSGHVVDSPCGKTGGVMVLLVVIPCKFLIMNFCLFIYRVDVYRGATVSSSRHRHEESRARSRLPGIHK